MLLAIYAEGVTGSIDTGDFIITNTLTDSQAELSSLRPSPHEAGEL